jgi:hypothetical protein
MRSITEESKSATVKQDDLEMAYSFVSDTYEIDAAAYVCRKTGKLEAWHTFENAATERILREWAEDEGFQNN